MKLPNTIIICNESSDAMDYDVIYCERTGTIRHLEYSILSSYNVFHFT